MIRLASLAVQHVLLAVAGAGILVRGFDGNDTSAIVLLASWVAFALCCVTFSRIVMHLARPATTLWPILPPVLTKAA